MHLCPKLYLFQSTKQFINWWIFFRWKNPSYCSAIWNLEIECNLKFTTDRMGGGVSIDSRLNSDLNGRYYCHSCHHVFVKSREEQLCGNCQSSFIEEMAEFRPTVLDRQMLPTLSADQSRRIANATAILRLLEIQLRHELEQLQTALEAANSSVSEGNNESKNILSPLMKAKLKKVPLNLDMYCSQPCCPICNEEFAMEESVLRMPCTHVFHQNCVMPWLELKQNCPICRFELENNLPTLEELELFSDEEVLGKFADLNAVIEDVESKSRSELQSMLMDLYQKYKDEHERSQSEETQHISLPFLTLITRS